MSELFPFLPLPTEDPEFAPTVKDKKHSELETPRKILTIFLQKDRNRRKVLKALFILISTIVVISNIPKYFAITKRYGRHSYYLHYQAKYDRCQFDVNGPVPGILMALGRSGSSVTWDTLSRLADDGDATVAYEITGGNQAKSRKYFDEIGDHIGDRWASLKLCNIQRYHLERSKKNGAHYSLVGFQWKPYKATFNHHYAVDGLRRVAEERLKVIYLTRNPLDRYISNLRHQGFVHSDEIPAHCEVNNEDCIKRHKEHSKSITINVEDEESRKKFKNTLESSIQADAMIETRLKELNVEHVHVTYENLFDGEASDEDEAKEWEKVLNFLGYPRPGLTFKDVRARFQLASTHEKSHRMSIANFDDVQAVLKGTKYEKLLH